MATETIKQIEEKIAQNKRSKRIALGITGVAAAEYVTCGIISILSGGQTIFFPLTLAAAIPLFGGLLDFAFHEGEEGRLKVSKLNPDRFR